MMMVDNETVVYLKVVMQVDISYSHYSNNKMVIIGDGEQVN